MKQLKCTSCGAPLEVFSAGTKTIGCKYCQAQIDLTSPQFAAYAGMAQPPIRAPLKVGQTGTLEAQGCQIIGHLRLAEQDWWWDEYLILLADGTTRWLQYDDGAFAIYKSVRLEHPLDPMSIGSTFHLGKVMYRVADRGRATIQRIEGELTWKAKVGDPMAWIDAVTPDIVGDPSRPRRLGVEWTSQELELFGKTAMTWREVAAAFGMTMLELEAGCYSFDDDDDDDDDSPELMQHLPYILIGIVAVAIILVAIKVATSRTDEPEYSDRDRVLGTHAGGSHRTVGGAAGARSLSSYRRGGYSRGSGFSFGK